MRHKNTPTELSSLQSGPSGQSAFPQPAEAVQHCRQESCEHSRHSWWAWLWLQLRPTHLPGFLTHCQAHLSVNAATHDKDTAWEVCGQEPSSLDGGEGLA